MPEKTKEYYMFFAAGILISAPELLLLYLLCLPNSEEKNTYKSK